MMGNSMILVVSFGTSCNESRVLTFDAIEEDIAKAFPGHEVRRAFASQVVIDKLKKRDGLAVDNVKEALDRAIADGIEKLVVQPSYMSAGYEYMELINVLKDYENQFEQIVSGAPLLSGDTDFDVLVKAIAEKTAAYDDGRTAICLMGHGTQTDANSVYSKIQDRFQRAGYGSYYIGTMKAAPALDVVIKALRDKGCYKRVILEPLMVAAGTHAIHNMAGAARDSWKSILEGEGYEVECILEGLGQIPAVRTRYVEHTREAYERIALDRGRFPIVFFK